MAVKLPKEVQKRLKAAIYVKADEFGYMHKSRTENGEFMDRLVRDSQVGGVIAEYLSKDSIKTYIKDAVLNRYMKDKKGAALPSDPKSLAMVVGRFYKTEALPIDGAAATHLYRLADDTLAIASQGTLLKWETALRKALEFVERSPGLPPKDGVFKILLNIASLGIHSTVADREHLRKSLALINVDINFAD